MSENEWPELQAWNIVVLGEQDTGKTCFADMFFYGHHFATWDPVIEPAKDVRVDNEIFKVSLMDVNNTHLRTLNPWSLNRKFYLNVFQNYGGFILLYDITSKQSFDHIIDNGYKRILDNRKRRTAEGPDGIPYPSGLQRFGCVLVGNKCDREDQRQVDRDLAQWWADSQGIKFFEIDSQKQFPINEIIVEVIRSTLRAQEYDDDELDEEMERRQKDDAVSDSKHKRTLSDSFQRVLKKLVP